MHFMTKIDLNSPSSFFNENALEILSGGNKQFCVELVEMFIDENNSNFTILVDAVAEANYETIAFISHKLKSSLKLVGVLDDDLFKTLEINAKNKLEISELEKQVQFGFQLYIHVKQLLSSKYLS